jgi:hypothetical protein
LKRLLQNALLALVSTAVALLLLEGLAQVYVYRLARQGKLFEPDPALGWRVLPNLDLERLNPDGDLWRIVTDDEGSRAPRAFRPDATTRVLVLGDSFAFGEGVSIDARFDSLLARDHPDWSFVNLGVQGYGTDQQMIQLRERADELRADDVLLVLTYGNDFYDLLRERHGGRAKPRFERGDDGALHEHAPVITWAETLRDRSYLLARLMSGFEKPGDFGAEDLARAGRLYRSLFEQIALPSLREDVRVLVAYHGLGYVADARARRGVTDGVASVCDMSRIECLPLDEALETAAADPFLADRHWNREGHRVAADAIGRRLATGGDAP